jgi:predicted nucleotidyltransferase
MSEAIINIIRDYFATQPVQKAWLFGSYARGEETPESDVDILVEFAKDADIGMFEHARMVLALEKLVGKDVDLVPEGTLLPYAERTADHDKKLIHDRI